MSDRTWVSHHIVPCPGNPSCKHCKPGEPQQHRFSKLVRDRNWPEAPKSPIEPLNMEYERWLRMHKFLGVSFENLNLVPFDPKIDPEPYACFICRSLLHLTRHCQETATFSYCSNCGRTGVTVEKCPRCTKAYREYLDNRRQHNEKKRQYSQALHMATKLLEEEDLNLTSGVVRVDEQFSKLKAKGKLKNESEEEYWDDKIMSLNSNDKCQDEDLKPEGFNSEYWGDINKKCQESVEKASFTAARVEKDAAKNLETASLDKIKQDNISSLSIPLTSQYNHSCSDSSKDFYGSRDADPNELFTFMRNKKMQDKLESALDSFGGSESEYYFHDHEEENYDDYIVDEDKRSESVSSEDYKIRFFVDLLNVLKDLPIDMQTKALLNFASTHKK